MCGWRLGVWMMSKRRFFFSLCPVVLNCNLSFHFPLCLKHICARAGQMDSVWEDDPDSYKLEFVFRDSKNVPRGRVSRDQSPPPYSVCRLLGLGPGPLSIDFALCLETLCFH